LPLIGSRPAANKTPLSLAQAKRRSDWAGLADDRKSSAAVLVATAVGAGALPRMRHTLDPAQRLRRRVASGEEQAGARFDGCWAFAQN
jgi:hypothetical protein